MSAAARLVAFAALLAGVFGAAALAGDQADIGQSEPVVHEASEEKGEGMNAMTTSHPGDTHAGDAPDPVRGLAVSEDSLTLELAGTRAAPGERFALGFRIVNSKGETVRDFDLEHTKRMHLIVARRDLTGFQHLHPTQTSDGSWSASVTLADPGVYRVFADFSTHETPRTLGADLTVDGDVQARPLPAPAASVRVDGLDVALTSTHAKAGEDAEQTYEDTRDGEPVEVEPYLGAQGHLVALREGDLAFLHVHPDADRLRFMAQFPSVGRYRLFLQFKTAGRIHTAAFTQEVAR
jgi:hypothetical protein